MQCVDVTIRVFVDDAIGDDNRSTLVSGANTVQRETTRKTSHGSEQTFESLRQVMGNVILVDLLYS